MAAYREYPGRLAQSAMAAHSGSRGGSAMQEGKVSSWDEEKGRGYIKPGGGGAEVFVTRSAITGALGLHPTFSSSKSLNLLPGELIRYEVARDGGGRSDRAVNISGPAIRSACVADLRPLCHDFMAGECARGADCPRSHGTAPIGGFVKTARRAAPGGSTEAWTCPHCDVEIFPSRFSGRCYKCDRPKPTPSAPPPPPAVPRWVERRQRGEEVEPGAELRFGPGGFLDPGGMSQQKLESGGVDAVDHGPIRAHRFLDDDGKGKGKGKEDRERDRDRRDPDRGWTREL